MTPAIAIIGGGASGASLAIHLLLGARCPVTITVFEPKERLGAGIAYSTQFESHLLNVPAADMSLFPDLPGHFVDWLRANVNPNATPRTFAPRRRYAQYLQSALADAVPRAADGVRFEHVRSGAVELRRNDDSWTITTEDGRALGASHVVLAMGNAPAQSPADGDADAVSAWSWDALDEVPKDADLLLVGTGLTAIDVCLALDERGHRGLIRALSRRGLLPLVHEPDARPKRWSRHDLDSASLSRLLSVLRKSARRSLQHGEPWHGWIDGLRPFTQDIWRRMAPADKRRFMRHLRPYWDVHRHRMAPEVAQTIARMRSAGRLETIRGRLVSTRRLPQGIEVLLRHRDGTERSFRVDRLINCIGAEMDIRRFPSPVLARLVASGHARYEPLFLGIDAAPNGALIDSTGTPHQNLFAIGPLLKGILWESIAMPEIRRQAAALAAELTSALDLTDLRAAGGR